MFTGSFKSLLGMFRDRTYNAAEITTAMGPLMDAFDRQKTFTAVERLGQVRQDGVEWTTIKRQNAIKIGNGEKLYKRTSSGRFMRNVNAFSDLMTSKSMNRIMQGLTIIGPPTMVFFDLFFGSAEDRQ